MQQVIHVNGHEIVFSLMGSRSSPPLVLLHGLGSFRDIWINTVEAIEREAFFIMVDLLGHGDSAKPRDGDYSIDAQARRVLAVVDALGIRDFGLLGHSMGGQIALHIASTLAPERVTRLIAVAPVISGRLSEHTHETARNSRRTYQWGWYARLLGVLVTIPAVARRAFGELYFYDMHFLPREVWFPIIAEICRPGVYFAFYRGLDAIHEVDLQPYLARIKAPTLMIGGRDDRVVRSDDFSIAHERIPDSQLELLDACGHFPMVEQPHMFQHAVRQFLLSRA